MDLVQRLASMKLAIGALVAVLVAMAAATIVESINGPEAAARAVYASIWFRLLLGVFALSLACSLCDQWPWGWKRAGFFLTHGSMLLILAGALVTDRLKVEGRMALWEGEESSTFGDSGRLPFSVRLESFEIDYHQGTRRPAMFRSRVEVQDLVSGRSFPAVIEMNHELSHAGYRLFQSSYQEAPGRDRSIFLVVRDPGQPIVFTGYALLLCGMVTVLATRIAQRRAAHALRIAAGGARATRRVAAFLAGVALAGAGAAAPVRAAGLLDPGAVDRLRRLPVQHDGRVMPLDTLAREATWQVTGLRTFRGIDPTSLVLEWTFEAERWAGDPLIPLSEELALAIGMAPGARQASFYGLVGNRRMMAMFAEARAAMDQKRPPGALLREARQVEDRLIWMQRFFQRKILRVVPPPGDPRGEWSPPKHLDAPGDLLPYLREMRPAAAPAADTIEKEVTYNRVRPARLSWWILLGASGASLLAWRRRHRWLDALALGGLAAGFAVMSWGLIARWQIAGRIPASNMYESLLFLGWGVALFALAALVFLRSRLVVLNAAAMSALTMLLADCLPIDPLIHPMPPVLSGTSWLAIHVPIIMLSYSVLALGVLIAHMRIGVEIVAPGRGDLMERMADLLYWYTHVGSILLIAGILSGSIWAASSWGRYWGWDPKEVWSLIAFLAYVAILHARLEGMVGPFGMAALSIVAFWTIIMTYVGVNYVLASGLHSYGFGGSDVVRWLIVVASIEGLFLGTGLLARRSSARRALALGPADPTA